MDRQRRVFPRTVLLVLFAFLMLSSCIKENRHSCPCILSLPLGESRESSGEREAALVSVETGHIFYQDRFLLSSCPDGVRRMEVARGFCSVIVASGIDGEQYRHDSLYVLPGCQWGPLMLSSCHLDCDRDEVEAPLVFHKEYCTLNLVMEGAQLGKTTPFEVKLLASCCGIRMSDCSPVRGTYCVYATSSVFPSMFTVRIPRQNTSDITLELMQEGSPLATFCLSYLLEGESYNWNKSNLDDIFVKIDYSSLSIRLEVRPWIPNEMNIEI